MHTGELSMLSEGAYFFIKYLFIDDQDKWNQHIDHPRNGFQSCQGQQDGADPDTHIPGSPSSFHSGKLHFPGVQFQFS